MEAVARVQRALSQELHVNTPRCTGAPAPVVHPQASLKGKVTLKAGSCIGAASVVDGGEGGIVIGNNTVIESRVTLTNTRPTPMVIGRFSWMEDFSSVKDVPRIGDFVRVESSAKVNNCKELGNGTTVAAGTIVENRGVIGPHSVLYGELGTLAHDESGIMRQAGTAAANLSKASP